MPYIENINHNRMGDKNIISNNENDNSLLKYPNEVLDAIRNIDRYIDEQVFALFSPKIYRIRTSILQNEEVLEEIGLNIQIGKIKMATGRKFQKISSDITNLSANIFVIIMDPHKLSDFDDVTQEKIKKVFAKYGLNPEEEKS